MIEDRKKPKGDKLEAETRRFLQHLTLKRAGRIRSFVETRAGFRHLNNADDKTGVTYAFWRIKDKEA